MAAQYKTKCPHCGAQFRISEQHLAQAKGAVRCGSCLKVFQATDHLVQDKPAQRPAAPKAATSKPAAAKSATAKPAAPANKWAIPDDAPAAATKAPAAKRWTLDDDLSDDMEEAVPSKLVDEPAPSRIAANDTRVSLGSLELSDSFMSLDSDDADGLHDENFSDMAGAGKKTQSDDSDESWAEKLLEELDDSEKPAPAPVSAAAMSLSDREEDAARRKQKEQRKQRTHQAVLGGKKKSTDNAPDWAMDSDDFFSDDTLGTLDEGSVEIAAISLPPIQERKAARVSLPFEQFASQSGELLKWAALSLAALLILAGQYLVFNFAELSRTPSWRPFYANLCGAVGCSLPNPSDVSRLRGANLVVRAHPTAANALVVDVIVFNNAEYPQPFPLLELGFTSLNGQAIASRRFQPAEYLRGDLTDMTEMPPGVPIRLSLEILDPGSAAQNYTLRFLPAPQQG
jgi:predicted Zn finger-like uncharacterized protein